MKTIIKKSFFKIFLSSLLFLSGNLYLLLFPVVSNSVIWKGYRVLITSLSQTENEILQKLKNQGIEDLISESNSILINKNSEAPIQPFLKEINHKRAAWFINSTKKIRYIYIREIPFLTNKVTNAFFETNIIWNLEGKDEVSRITVFFSLLLFLSGFIIIKNKYFVLFCNIPFLLFTISNNQLVGFISSVFAIYSSIVIIDLTTENRFSITRKQKIKRMIYQKKILIPISASLLSAFSGGMQSSLLFMIALLTSLSSIPFSKNLKYVIDISLKKKRLHPEFSVQVMHPDSIVKGLSRKVIFLLSILCFLLLLSGILFYSLTINKQTSKNHDLYIPSPSGYTKHKGLDITGYSEILALKNESNLPDLTDFLVAQWQIYSFPYKKIQDKINMEKDNVVSFTEYLIDKNGFIFPKIHILNTFNNEFIKKRLSLDITPLEKMLINQNRFITVSHEKENNPGYKPDKLFSLLQLLYLLIPGAAIIMRLKK